MPGGPHRLLRVLALVLPLLAGGAGLAAGLGSPNAATGDPDARRQLAGVKLELIEQSFTLQPGGNLRLVYRLTGDLDDVADLAPTTTAPPTTTPPTTSTTPATTAPPTTAPPTDAASGDAAGPTTAPEANETVPATTTPAPTTTLPPLAQLTINIANFEPITRVEPDDPYLNRILGQRALAGAFIGNIDGVQLADVRPRVVVHDDGTATLTVVVPTDVDEGDQSGPGSLEFPNPGLYPIRVQLLIDDDLAATHGTVIERVPGDGELLRESEPVNIALVANVDRASDPGGSVDRADNQFERVVALAAAVDSPVLVAVPPDVLAVAVARDEDGTIAEALSDDELATITNIALDVSSAVAAGQSDVFTRDLIAGEDALAQALPTTPSGRNVWVASRPLSGDGAQLLRDLGFRFTVMTPELYADTINDDRPATDRFVNIALPDETALPTLILDPLSEQLTDRATDEVLASATATEWAVRTVAEIVLDHRRSGRTVQRSRVLSTPNLDAPNPVLLVALERLAATTPDLRFVAASALAGLTDTQGGPRSVTRAYPAAAGPDLTQRVDDIAAARLELASAASMLIAGDGRLEEWNVTLDSLITTGIANATADAVIEQLRTDAARIRGSIDLPEPFTFTMTGRSDEITLRLGNRSEEALDVIVRLESSKLTFPNNDQVVRLRANDSTDVQIPVKARSNGTSPVTVTVLTPLGEQLGESVALRSRVNAFTGLGQVLTGAFILMLLTWWFSNWRRRRRAADAGDAEEEVGAV